MAINKGVRSQRLRKERGIQKWKDLKKALREGSALLIQKVINKHKERVILDPLTGTLTRECLTVIG